MSDPPYLLAILAKGGATPFAIERGILRQWKPEWSRARGGPFWHEEEIIHMRPVPPQKVSGWTQHFIRYLRLLLPKMQVNPWLVEMIQAVEQTYFVEGRKIANFIGSKNSGKTTFFSIMAHVIVSIWPEYSRCYISGPYKSAADATIWGRVSTHFSQIQSSEHHTMVGLKGVPSKGRYVYDDTSEESGYVELVTLDKVGKLQGAKSMDTERGMLLLICDEISTFPSRALLDALGNLTGNANFLCMTGCNFRDTEGLEGDLCRPEGREFSELSPEMDFSWKSAHKSMTYRFDGHRCPNVVHNKVIYPYLLREDVRKDMEDIHGLTGPKYLEQIRSAPISTMSDFYVTNRERIKASGAHEPVVWEGEDRRVAFCDPGFGGDPCKIGVFRFGPARIEKTDGTFSTMNAFAPVEPIQTIKLAKDLVADEPWLARLRNVTQGQMFLRPGSPVTLENQIVVQAAEYCRKHHVPFSMLGFDGSMRAAIVHEFVAVMGPQVVSMDFGGMPTERSNYLVAGKRACDEYANFVTELWFNAGGVLQSGQFRNADMVPAAIAQLCRRSWKHMGAKKQIQPKGDFKESNQGRSPDDADVLAGALEMALRSGFATVTRRRPEAAEFASFASGGLQKLFSGGRIVTTYGSKQLRSPTR
jgi:hypothetical protein